MIIVKIIGGLGNQMFQYSYAKALELKGYDVKIDIKGFENYKLHGGFHLNRYDIDLNIATSKELAKYKVYGLSAKIKNKFGIPNKKILKAASTFYESELLSPDKYLYLDGYFQSEKYFLNIRDMLIMQFSLKENISIYSERIKKKIQQSSECCSIHIRRGDYLENKNEIHGVCGLQFYKEAMKIMKARNINIKFFIFSDDISWAKEHLQAENIVYVSSEEDRIPHEDIYLMSMCDHNIIANSTFSWWGAWLNQSKDKLVIAPYYWFSNENINKLSASSLVPGNWLRI